eukprot:TRINITY_DN561_c2_g1_i2.p1 TRINITY_DN561_c2_g1~~TRINITY_DN561_c2_g1_i2.p1  ORF type:complete len:598 (+),score=144.66 TRINITY_DN561_c2_g1_i2:1199-2992(+)
MTIPLEDIEYNSDSDEGDDKQTDDINKAVKEELAQIPSITSSEEKPRLVSCIKWPLDTSNKNDVEGDELKGAVDYINGAKHNYRSTDMQRLLLWGFFKTKYHVEPCPDAMCKILFDRVCVSKNKTLVIRSYEILHLHYSRHAKSILERNVKTKDLPPLERDDNRMEVDANNNNNNNDTVNNNNINNNNDSNIDNNKGDNEGNDKEEEDQVTLWIPKYEDMLRVLKQFGFDGSGGGDNEGNDKEEEDQVTLWIPKYEDMLRVLKQFGFDGSGGGDGGDGGGGGSGSDGDSGDSQSQFPVHNFIHTIKFWADLIDIIPDDEVLVNIFSSNDDEIVEFLFSLYKLKLDRLLQSINVSQSLDRLMCSMWKKCFVPKDSTDEKLIRCISMTYNLSEKLYNIDLGNQNMCLSIIQKTPSTDYITIGPEAQSKHAADKFVPSINRQINLCVLLSIYFLAKTTGNEETLPLLKSTDFQWATLNHISKLINVMDPKEPEKFVCTIPFAVNSLVYSSGRSNRTTRSSSSSSSISECLRSDMNELRDKLHKISYQFRPKTTSLINVDLDHVKRKCTELATHIEVLLNGYLSKRKKKLVQKTINFSPIK